MVLEKTLLCGSQAKGLAFCFFCHGQEVEVTKEELSSRLSRLMAFKSVLRNVTYRMLALCKMLWQSAARQCLQSEDVYKVQWS